MRGGTLLGRTPRLDVDEQLRPSINCQPELCDHPGWTTICGNIRVDEQLIVARTIRTRLLTIPRRIANSAGQRTLRLPTD